MRVTCWPPAAVTEEGAGLDAGADCPVLTKVPPEVGPAAAEAAKPAHPLVTCPLRGAAAFCSCCAAAAAAALSWLAAATHPPWRCGPGASTAGLEVAAGEGTAGSGLAAGARPAGAVELARLEGPAAGLSTRGDGPSSGARLLAGAADGTGRSCCLVGPAGDAKGEVGLKGC